jgi:hypothetical protein
MKTHRPSRGEREEAKRYPNGFVYRISGPIDPNGHVPPEAIAGAWKVDALGNVQEFIPNPKHDPIKWSGRESDAD